MNTTPLTPTQTRPLSRPEPTQLTPLDATSMSIRWSNGERYSVPYTELRFACPCAGCVDEHTGQRLLKRENISNDVRVTGAEVIGRYAICLKFSDGHQTGMYHFDRLNELCLKMGKLIEALA